MFIALVSFFAVAGVRGEDRDPATVLVRINGTPVTEAELEVFLKGFFLTEEGRMQWEDVPHFERREARSNALQMMIERRLLLSKARGKFGDRRVDAHVAEAVEQMISEMEAELGSRIGLMEKMHESGITLKDWKQFQSETMLIHSYMAEELSGIHIRPVEMEEYYRRNKDEFQVPKKIFYRVLYLTPGARESREDVRERADHLLELIEKGHCFQELAGRYCFYRYDEKREAGALQVEPVPADNPDWRPRAVAGLEAGEVSGEMRGDFYVIAKLEQLTPAGVRAFAEVQDKINNRIRERKMAETQGELIEELHKNADIQFTEAGRRLVGNGTEMELWQQNLRGN